jgi:hypothetical protein
MQWRITPESCDLNLPLDPYSYLVTLVRTVFRSLHLARTMAGLAFKLPPLDNTLGAAFLGGTFASMYAIQYALDRHICTHVSTFT